MSASVEASVLIKELASPAPAGAHVETLIRNVARRLGWSQSRARDVWYRNARRIDAEEIDALRKAARERAAGAAGRGTDEQHEDGRTEPEYVRRIEDRLVALEAELARLSERMAR